MARRTLLWSPAIFLSKKTAEQAEAKAVENFLLTGKIPSDFTNTNESVKQLLKRRVEWLQNNRSAKHARDSENAFNRALFHVEDWYEMPASTITPEMVADLKKKWGKDLQARGKSMDDINRTFGFLQAAWNGPWDNRRGPRDYPENPFAYIERYSGEKKAKKHPTDEQVKKTLESIAGEKRLFLEILCETGARPGEGVQIAWEDVFIDEPPCSIILWTRKKRGGSRTPRRMKIGPDLAVKLRNWRDQNPESIYVFQQDKEKKPRHYRWAVDVQEIACENAKINYFSPHGWRHYYASKLVAEGKSLIEVQNSLGHENAKTTSIYLHELLGN
ncbi:MAG: integrase family protein [Deltaproteobacteria bacterium]|nr:integrase family protein [Deltaproteobacteria bacterium]